MKIISVFLSICIIGLASAGECSYKGTTYGDGESWRDGCKYCSCNNGRPNCMRMGCTGSEEEETPGPVAVDARPTCTFNGITYEDGQNFMNECNGCSCDGGLVRCTIKACVGNGNRNRNGNLNGNRSRNRNRNRIGNLNGNRNRNRHGSGDLLNVQRTGGCTYKGQSYSQFGFFMDGCNKCFCRNGEVGCTNNPCR